MGTTLTGLTPATTYDALIKVTDNGPLSATAKYLSDGLGNDSILALSSNKVGIGTFAPSQPLHVNGNMRLNGALYDNNNLAGTSGQILSSTGTATNWIDVSSLGVVDGSGTANYVSKWSDPNTLTNSLIYDNGTNVGIGTSSPTSKLSVSGDISATNITLSNYGSATTAVVGLGDGNTGLFRPAVNTFGITTAGSEKMRITSAGNVGIGTSSPSTKLQVVGGGLTTSISNAATTSTSRFDLANPSISLGIGYVGTDIPMLQSFNNGTNGATNLTINPFGGNVGIGTTSPAKILTVSAPSGDTILRTNAVTGSYAGLELTENNSTTSGQYWQINKVPTSHRLQFWNGSERLTILSNGNVGIGTSSPVQRLSILAGNGNQLGLDNAGERFTQISFLNNASQKAAIWLDETTDEFAIYAAAGYEVPIYANGIERLRITSAGNVGIGLTNPSYKLQVSDTTANGRAVQGVQTGTTGTNYGAVFAAEGVGATKNVGLYANASGATTNYAAIFDNGNVGIGTSSPSVKLDVAGQVKAAGSDYHTFSVASGSAQIRLERTGTSTGVSYIGADNDGLKVFNSSFSELARIDSSGNLSLISGNIALSASGGIYFDNAASKYLDDYEVGSWTPTISFGRASVGVTYGAGNAGQYTKVGRQVTLTAFIILTSKGSSTGTARIGGLPFAIGATTGYYSAPSLGAFSSLSYTGTPQGFGEVGAQTIELNEVSEAGTQSDINDTNFANTTSFVVSFTYFV